MQPLIQHNAARLRELHACVKAAVRRRTDSPEAHAAWQEACREFHEQYDNLAFPGGLTSGFEKIRQGDGLACDTALTYLEHPPYCFRSQYVKKDLRRALNKATLRPDLAARFALWKQSESQRKISAREKRVLGP